MKVVNRKEFLAMPVHSAQTLDLTNLAGAPVSSERIHPGDVLDISIAAGLGADAVTEFPLRVSDDGYLPLPEIGPVFVAGLELSGAEHAIAAAAVAAAKASKVYKKRRLPFGSRLFFILVQTEPDTLYFHWLPREWATR